MIGQVICLSITAPTIKDGRSMSDCALTAAASEHLCRVSAHESTVRQEKWFKVYKVGRPQEIS